MESTAPPARCEIARLPEDLLSAALARTAPRDACRAAAVSPAFRAAADADAVWSRLLPRDLPALADGELPADPLPRKELFMRLSDPGRPVVLADGLTSMWLDRDTAAKYYMLSARKLSIIWGDTPQYWRWIPLNDSSSRVSEVAELLAVCWLEIRGKIQCKMLSENTTYAAYMVYKMSDRSYGLDLDYPPQRAEVSTGVTKSKRRVCLQVYDDDRRAPPVAVGDVHPPQTRTDGWMEMEMGEFNNEQGGDGEVSISLTGRGGHWKRGLIVEGIEIRVKK